MIADGVMGRGAFDNCPIVPVPAIGTEKKSNKK
jgi:hypothetical protein